LARNLLSFSKPKQRDVCIVAIERRIVDTGINEKEQYTYQTLKLDDLSVQNTVSVDENGIVTKKSEEAKSEDIIWPTIDDILRFDDEEEYGLEVDTTCFRCFPVNDPRGCMVRDSLEAEFTDSVSLEDDGVPCLPNSALDSLPVLQVDWDAVSELAKDDDHCKFETWNAQFRQCAIKEFPQVDKWIIQEDLLLNVSFEEDGKMCTRRRMKVLLSRKPQDIGCNRMWFSFAKAETMRRRAEDKYIPDIISSVTTKKGEDIDARIGMLKKQRTKISHQDDPSMWSGKIYYGFSRLHSYGLFAAKSYKKNEEVCKYIGEHISKIKCDLMEMSYVLGGLDSTYMFRLKDDAVDSTHAGNWGRFINHSCESNCTASTVGSSSEANIIIRACRPIQKGEELTYDYKLPYESKENAIRCLCGSPKCRGYLNYQDPQQ
ncbi:hypothetical protein ADUPG1_007038, partial [Aduncisulcus paluster]